MLPYVLIAIFACILLFESGRMNKVPFIDPHAKKPKRHRTKYWINKNEWAREAQYH